MPEVLVSTKTSKSPTGERESTAEAMSATDQKDESKFSQDDKNDSVESVKMPEKKKAKLFKQHISMSLDPSPGVKESPDVVMLDSSVDKRGDGDGPQSNQREEKNETSLEGMKSSDQKTTSSSIEATGCENTESQTDINTTQPLPKKKKNTSTKETSVKPTATKEDLYATAWTSCYSVAFNKNGTYLASGHASGLIPVHSFASRCLNAIYSPPTSISVKVCKADKMPGSTTRETRTVKHVNGTTSLAWDTTGKYLLAGAYGDNILRFMDNSHPSVAWECAKATKKTTLSDPSMGDKEIDITDKIQRDNDADSVIAVYYQYRNRGARTYFQLNVTSVGKGRLLESREILLPSPISYLPSQELQQSRTVVPCLRHPYLLFQLPQPLGGACQLHPTHNDIGMARLMDSSLVLFFLPAMAFYEMMPNAAASTADTELRRLLETEEENRAGNILYLVPPVSAKKGDTVEQYSVICASFGKGRQKNTVYAITKCGTLLGFEITQFMLEMLRGGKKKDSKSHVSDVAKIPHGASAIQIVVNERYILVNSLDALRLYSMNDLWSAGTVTPKFVFQDPVSKAPWVSCDFSADGEFVVGGKDEDNYQLFLWNVVTGELLDQLTGPQVSLYCLTCHPTRPFIAVGSSDGMVSSKGVSFDQNPFYILYSIFSRMIHRSICGDTGLIG